jgi:hypothetical protein
MGLSLKVGSRYRSAVCGTEVVVIRAAGGSTDLRCGGAAMVELAEQANQGAATAPFDRGSALGKRYVLEPDLEVLCTRPGLGSLSVGATELTMKTPKPIPNSD